MKLNILTILTVGLLLGINACCTKKDCVNSDEIHEIEFYNFSQADLDTIALISYAKNSNFTAAIDSSITQANKTGDYSTVYTKDKINTTHDYKIKLLSTGQVFTLTGFEIEKRGCNTCFPYRPESDYYNILGAYQINGQRQTGSRIKIYR
ncbi:MAG: hypothetical protein JSS64_08210 [Bacteroidetes bacterium]|nr:hypothetical protein [Bacteroidota bacterium]